MTRRSFIIGGILLIMVAVSVYFYFDPESCVFFPKCPWLSLTGSMCPGCGSQRAIHALLHGDIAAAWRYNALLLLFIPYIIVLIIAELRRSEAPRFYSKVTSPLAIVVCGAVILAWWILRNVM